MKRDGREVVEGIQYQGVDEQIIYSLTTTNWGSNPTATVSVKAYDVTDDYTDVSGTVLSGSASVSDDVITLPKVKSLTLGHLYRIEVQFTITGVGTPFEAYIQIEGTR